VYSARDLVIAAIAGAAVALATVGLVNLVHADTGTSQKSFPCKEDEVLGYAPQFGPDKVGCIHIDDLK
jgi:Gene product 79